jgi:hypothetical protein
MMVPKTTSFLFFTLLNIRRKDEGWQPAAYCKVTSGTVKSTIDLLVHFAHVPEKEILSQVMERWQSSTINCDMHMVGHSTFNSRLLAKLLRSSLTDDFHLVMINYIPHSLHSDGTYMLWAFGNHIHRNNVAFLEHVREQIITATLANYGNDILKYIMAMKNRLCMISSPIPNNHVPQSGLVIYILRQLKLS